MDSTKPGGWHGGRKSVRIEASLRALTHVLVLAVQLAWVPAVAGAAGLEDLVSPGALIEAHAREAKACGACHDKFDRSSQNRLCLECHDDIALDVTSKSGLHGRFEPGGECRVCHTEHKGAKAGIRGLSAESFDHRRTDFALEGAHAAIDCGACHPAGKSRREADHDCFACHASADPHGGRLGEQCSDCHSAAGWGDVVFDHSGTRFDLVGKHADAACESCHPRQRFEATPLECVACHRADDVHRGRLGKECGDCHSPRAWKEPGFDHGRKTGFALSGAHASTSCRACHAADPASTPTPTDCNGCHRLDDVHRGARGVECGDCHGERSWSPSRFDHLRDANHALAGGHAEVACELCHVGPPATATTPTRCVECHETDDVHRGRLGADCSGCHGEASWQRDVSFDHDLTDFPLLSLHQLASCEDCHGSHQFSDAETDCMACHARSDVHERRLGNDCVRCHNPNGWSFWTFDHEAETKFALAGGHDGLQCTACHLAPTSGASTALDVSTRCDSCHLGDSPHDDAFGRDCARCHVVESWERTEQGVR